MRTYVTSLNKRARLAHIGNSYWTACGVIPSHEFKVTNDVPDDRTLCPRCVARYARKPHGLRAAAREARRTAATARREATERMILNDLRQGRTTSEIMRLRKISQRSFVRHTRRMRLRVGARTTFQWAYLVGLADREPR